MMFVLYANMVSELRKVGFSTTDTNVAALMPPTRLDRPSP